MESFFSSLKSERTARKVYRTRDDAKADVFDYIERFYNPKRRHSTLGYLSPMEFENKVGLSLTQYPKYRQQARASVARLRSRRENEAVDRFVSATNSPPFLL
ncbi:IS3 family transposase [Rhizobium ruizarguesonis]